MWPLYGWFSALVLCGSCFGAITWSAWMQFSVYYFMATDYFEYSHALYARHLQLIALANRWRASYTVCYPVHFLCLCAAKLLVFDRMSDFSSEAEGSSSKRKLAARRAVFVVVVTGVAFGLGGSLAAASHFARAADLFSESSTYFASNLSLGSDFQVEASAQIALAFSLNSVQELSDAIVLLLVVLTFTAVSAACIHRIKSAMALIGTHSCSSAAAQAAKQLQRRVLFTAIFVLVSFALRGAHSTMNAAANQLQDVHKACPSTKEGLCDACYNMFTHMQRWMIRTPEFQLSVVLISSPIALLVSLWGMTPGSLWRALPRDTQRRLEPSAQQCLLHVADLNNDCRMRS